VIKQLEKGSKRDEETKEEGEAEVEQEEELLITNPELLPDLFRSLLLCSSIDPSTRERPCK
jgi:hypothetical protein